MNFLVNSLAEALDMQPPVIPEDVHTTRVTSGEDASSPAAGKDSSVLEVVWGDEDTRGFYECLPDLRAFVPAVLLGEAEPKVNEQSVKVQEQATAFLCKESASEPEQGQSATQDAVEVAADSSTSQEAKSVEKGKDKEEKDKEKAKDPDKEKGKEKDPERKGETEKEKLKGLEGTNLDALLQRLPGCVGRDLIDQLTVEFCYLNSKSNRKRLVRTLFNVPRTSLELLPYYSCMVGTLSTCMKDVSSMLLQMLEEEFNFLINKKDQMNIETKIRNIRFIGELCKFKIASAGLIFTCLKQDVLDPQEDCFRMRMVITLLETCGHYFDQGSSKRKLYRFLIHFQRYILSKGFICGLMSQHDSNSSIEEVNAALIDLEEHERNVSTEKAHCDKYSDAENSSGRTTTNSISSNGKSGVRGTEENGGVHEDSDSESGSDTIDPEGHDEEGLDEENHDEGDNEDDDDDERGGPASDEDDEVRFR
ncbi:hypothetical protein Q3G72_034056 [Acer saccharum]|nr:hypothetical protein Q3G72_034056 [Acer saccharum]